MIRIDEIYYNVFVSGLQHRPGVGLHWFDPFGSVDFKDICNIPPVDHTADLRVIFWDQEPVYKDKAAVFFDQFCGIYQGSKIIVTSERGSDLDWVCDTYGLAQSHYFFHGWAALDWYRGYEHSFLSVPWQDREFSARIFCPNNIIGGRRTHRLKLFSAMEQHDLIADNLISFPAVCPYEKISVQELLKQHRLKDTKINLPLIIDQDKNHANGSHRIDFWQQVDIQQRCQDAFRPVNEMARDLDVRLCFHPGEFCLLVGDHDDLVQRRVNQSRYHTHLAQ